MTTAAVIALLQVVQSSSFTYTGQALQQLQVERTILKAEVLEIEAEVAALASLERTERAARERLGMIRARNISYLSVQVEAPSGPLLPRPLVEPIAKQPLNEAWWKSLFRALPLP